MKIRILSAIIGLGATLSLSSCIIQQGISLFIRNDYPGTRPPSVIADVQGKPANQNWQKVDAEMLPPSSHAIGRIHCAGDGLPYGLTTNFSNIVMSPYPPYHQLDYTGVRVGSKVWDPYVRKPFYIPRAYKFN